MQCGELPSNFNILFRKVNMRERKFKGYLRISFVELPNNELGTINKATEDWRNIIKITKKPRKYFVSCYLKLESGSVHHVNINFQDKSNSAQDIKVLMKQAFNIAKQDLDEPVLLSESYFIITA